MSGNYWTSKTPMPTPRVGASCAQVNNVIYVIGGKGMSGSTLKVVEAYNVTTNTWQTGFAPMPTPRDSLSAVAMNGKIYAIGGYNGSVRYNKVEVYDPGLNSWSAVKNMPSARGGLGAAQANGVIYVIGGYNSSFMRKAEAYCPVNDTWWTCAQMPTSRSGLGVTAINGIVYAMGGGNPSYLTTVEAYNTSSNTWQSRTPMPYARGGDIASINSTVYMMGGWNVGTVSRCDAYDSSTNSWSNVQSMITARAGAVAVANWKLYDFGGSDGTNPIDKNEEYTPLTITLPSAPRNIGATPGDKEVVLQWTAPSSDGGSPVTNYRIYRGTSAGTETFITQVGTLSVHTDTGLTNGVKYYYNVTAVNAVGEGASSNEVNATPMSPTVPSVPRNPQATAGDAQVTLDWVAPSTDGGSPVTNYKIYRSTSSGGETYLTQVGIVLTFLDTGLTNGLKYYYNMTAVNSVGEGLSSSEVNATPVPSATVPSAPRNLQATAGDAQVTLDWTAPSSDGGSAILHYKIYRGTFSGATTFLTQVGSVVTYTNTGLTNGQKYYYNVTATNAIGEGASSNEASATPTAGPGVPTAPQNLAVTSGDTRVNLTWDPPSSDGGSSVTNYYVYRGSSAGGSKPRVGQTGSGSVRTYTDTSLTNGMAYYYQVSAKNAVGEGAKSNEASATPKSNAPGYITGKAMNDKTLDAIVGAVVTVNETGASTITGSDGKFNVTIAPGTYNLSVTAAGLRPDYESDIDVYSGLETDILVLMSPLTGTLKGTVTDKVTGAAIEYATVTPSGYMFGETTDASGNYEIKDLDVGAYSVLAKALFYKDSTANVTITADQTVTLDFQLEKSDVFTKATVIGAVTDSKTKNPIQGVKITIGTETAYTDVTGVFNMTVDPGTYTVSFSKSGYRDATEQKTFVAGTLYQMTREMMPSSSAGGDSLIWIVLVLIIVIIAAVIIVIAVVVSRKRKAPETIPSIPSPAAYAPQPFAPVKTYQMPKEELATGELSPVEKSILDMIKQHPGADPRWLARVLDLRADNLQQHIRALTNAGYISVLRDKDKDDLGYYVKGTEAGGDAGSAGQQNEKGSG